MIYVSKIFHKEKVRILLSSVSEGYIKNQLKSLNGILYSKTHAGWHLPYTKQDWNAFLKLNLTFTIEDTGTTGTAMPISDHAGKNIADTPQDSTQQAADTQQISIRCQHLYFYVRGINAEQISDIKSIPGSYWNSRYHNWVLPAKVATLNVLHKGLGIITSGQRDIWEKHIISLTEPPTCVIYSSPEYPDSVLVQVKGHEVDVEFLKHIPERTYRSDGKFWVIPNDANIITRINDHYVSKGTKVTNRAKVARMASKKMGYAELRTYLLSKTADNVHHDAKAYLDTLITQRYSIATIREYYARFAQFALAVWPKKCNEIDEAVVNAYICDISSNKISESLINSYINAIKFYYQKVIYLPSFKIERIKRPRKGHYLPKVLSVQQVDGMLRGTNNLKHTTLLYALYGHGIRLNELLSLRLDDLLWDRNQVFVHQGKGNKDRYIPMSQQFKAIMQIYIHEYKPQYWLFEGQDQKSQYSERSVQQVVKQAAIRASISIRVTPHMLRHSYATHLLDVGTQLPYIKELLGHSSIKTTMIYTHVTTASIENVVSPLDRLMKDEIIF